MTLTRWNLNITGFIYIDNIEPMQFAYGEFYPINGGYEQNEISTTERVYVWIS